MASRNRLTLHREFDPIIDGPRGLAPDARSLGLLRNRDAIYEMINWFDLLDDRRIIKFLLSFLVLRLDPQYVIRWGIVTFIEMCRGPQFLPVTRCIAEIALEYAYDRHEVDHPTFWEIIHYDYIDIPLLNSILGPF